VNFLFYIRPGTVIAKYDSKSHPLPLPYSSSEAPPFSP
jgi:hypothetical protein